jgi:hypothetical protein
MITSCHDRLFQFIMNFWKSDNVEVQVLPTNIRNMHRDSYRFAIKSERILLSRSTKFFVRRYFWYTVSKSHQGRVEEKKLFSICLAPSQVTFDFKSWEDSCLTQNQLFSRGTFSFRMNGSQLPSSPVGIRSGFVRTPTKYDSQLLKGATSYTPIVRFPSGSYCWAS